MTGHEDPKSSLSEFELPGGVLWTQENGDKVLLKHVLMKEITGEEEDILTNRKIAVEDRMMQLVANCMDRISDNESVIIDNKSHIVRIVKKMMITDLIYCILLARRVSLGDVYSFKVTCTNPDCGMESSQAFDLDHIEVKEPIKPEELIWEIELPRSGKTVKMKVMQAEDQKRARSMLQRDRDIMTTQLLTRVVEIDGKPPAVKDLKSLPLMDRNKIRNSFQEKEGGIETDIDIICPTCDNRFKVGMEIQGIDFFFPSET
jgi:hypothetical protein